MWSHAHLADVLEYPSYHAFLSILLTDLVKKSFKKTPLPIKTSLRFQVYVCLEVMCVQV